ncbi:C16orf87 isoform 3 [Pongo abelii]|uniref:C16orf87 isoform 3 n=1 Tax=Pongo abelii TaxID=9601 RepID=A0A2J8VY26_PONAB|nr:C16orf87 isoform 3 [Pongo abelii]
MPRVRPTGGCRGPGARPGGSGLAAVVCGGGPCRAPGGRAVPVACKSCPCGYIFISRKLLNAKHSEKSPPSTENKHEAKRRRTERVRREKINSTVNKDLENRKRSRSNSHSDHIRRGRGRPKSASAKKHEEERGCRKPMPRTILEGKLGKEKSAEKKEKKYCVAQKTTFFSVEGEGMQLKEENASGGG